MFLILLSANEKAKGLQRLSASIPAGRESIRVAAALSKPAASCANAIGIFFSQSALQCRNCRHINYERLDAFLCVECGHSGFGTFAFSLRCTPCPPGGGDDLASGAPLGSAAERRACLAELAASCEASTGARRGLEALRPRLAALAAAAKGIAGDFAALGDGGGGGSGEGDGAPGGDGDDDGDSDGAGGGGAGRGFPFSMPAIRLSSRFEASSKGSPNEHPPWFVETLAGVLPPRGASAAGHTLDDDDDDDDEGNDDDDVEGGSEGGGEGGGEGDDGMFDDSDGSMPGLEGTALRVRAFPPSKDGFSDGSDGEGKDDEEASDDEDDGGDGGFGTDLGRIVSTSAFAQRSPPQRSGQSAVGVAGSRAAAVSLRASSSSSSSSAAAAASKFPACHALLECYEAEARPLHALLVREAKRQRGLRARLVRYRGSGFGGSGFGGSKGAGLSSSFAAAVSTTAWAGDAPPVHAPGLSQGCAATGCFKCGWEVVRWLLSLLRAAALARPSVCLPALLRGRVADKLLLAQGGPLRCAAGLGATIGGFGGGGGGGFCGAAALEALRLVRLVTDADPDVLAAVHGERGGVAKDSRTACTPQKGLFD